SIFQFRKVPYDRLGQQRFARIVRSGGWSFASWFDGVGGLYDCRLGGAQRQPRNENVRYSGLDNPPLDCAQTRSREILPDFSDIARWNVYGEDQVQLRSR